MEAQPELFPRLIDVPKRPLLKWAGGKTQLLDTLRRAMPSRFSRYAELFFGGGALFWSLGLPDSLITDSNPELIKSCHCLDNVDRPLQSVGTSSA
jgi:DNA adenine methylase